MTEPFTPLRGAAVVYWVALPGAPSLTVRVVYPLASRLEEEIPGALVYGTRAREWGMARIVRQPDEIARQTRLNPGYTPMPFDDIQVHVPLNAAWLFEPWARANGLRILRATPVNLEGVDLDHLWLDPTRAAEMRQRGSAIAREMEADGLLRSGVADMLTPYQQEGIGWATTRPWMFADWPCGAGKTLAAIISSMWHARRAGPQRGVLVLCPAKARKVWSDQVPRYTTTTAFRLIPASERRKKDPTLEDYHEGLAGTGRPPVYVAGVESLPDWVDFLQKLSAHPRFGFASFVFDEIHLGGSFKRWSANMTPTGKVDVQYARTDTGKRLTRAAATHIVSTLPGITFRMGLSATPLDDGRPRRLFAQFDIIYPTFAGHSSRPFRLRYCGGVEGDYGLDDSGASNIGELKRRAACMVHEIPYSTVNSELPADHLKVRFVPPEDLDRSRGSQGKKEATEHLREVMKAAQRNRLVLDEAASDSYVEAALAYACALKKPVVLQDVQDALEAGGKVVVFVARRAICEDWGRALEDFVARSESKVVRQARVWWAHGGTPERQREDILDAYQASDGPCVLVGTFQAFGTSVDELGGSDMAAVAMLPWRPEGWSQMLGRFTGLRQKGKATQVRVYIAERTYDERVLSILTGKFSVVRSMFAAEDLRGIEEKMKRLDDEGFANSLFAKIAKLAPVLRDDAFIGDDDE